MKKKTLLIHAQLYIFVILFLSIPAIIGHLPILGDLTKPPFNPLPLEEMSQSHPECVFIGNSMMYTRIDPTTLQGLIGSDAIYFIYSHGSASAHWYLNLKNYIAPLKTKPKKVFIFFRDNNLTLPNLQTTGKYEDALLTTAHAKEPLLDALLLKHNSFKDKVFSLFARAYPSLNKNRTYNGKLSKLIAVALTGGKTSADQLLANINDRLNVKHFRDFGVTPPTTEVAYDELDFATSYQKSFLPHIIDLAKENNVELVFIRVKRRPTGEASHEFKTHLNMYMANLRSYIEANAMQLIDFNDTPGLTLDKYGEGDHIGKEYLVWYTELFYNKTKQIYR